MLRVLKFVMLFSSIQNMDTLLKLTYLQLVHAIFFSTPVFSQAEIGQDRGKGLNIESWVRLPAKGAIQIICDTWGGGAGLCYQISQGGGKGSAKMSRDIF